jgi:hypothetical protein
MEIICKAMASIISRDDTNSQAWTAKYREMGGGRLISSNHNIKNAAAVKSRLTCDFSPGNHVIDNASRALPSWRKNYFETKWPFMGHQCGIGGCFGRQIIQRLHPSGGWGTQILKHPVSSNPKQYAPESVFAAYCDTANGGHQGY